MSVLRSIVPLRQRSAMGKAHPAVMASTITVKIVVRKDMAEEQVHNLQSPNTAGKADVIVYEVKEPLGPLRLIVLHAF